MKTCVVLLAFVWLALSSNAQSAPVPSDDAAVLSAVTHKLCDLPQTDGPSGYYVLPNTNDGAVDETWPEGLDQHAMESLANRNSTTQVLPSFSLCSRVRLVPAAWLYKFRGWAWFHAAFPGSSSVLRLSMPGYSKSGGVAIVLVSITSGVMASGGTYWILQKRGGNWVVIKKVLAWVS